jgi:hypothetical protein
MAVYESTDFPFSIQYPADWTEEPPLPEQGIVARFVSQQGGALFIAEEDLVAGGVGKLGLTEYVDLVLSVVSEATTGYELVSREQRITPQGLSIEVVEYAFFGGAFKYTRLVYLHEGAIGFNATYFAPKARHEELQPLIEYSFSTFGVSKE